MPYQKVPVADIIGQPRGIFARAHLLSFALEQTCRLDAKVGINRHNPGHLGCDAKVQLGQVALLRVLKWLKLIEVVRRHRASGGRQSLDRLHRHQWLPVLEEQG